MAGSASYSAARDTVGRMCRAGRDSRRLRLEVLGAIRRAVGFDSYAWLVTDPETSVGSSPLADVPCLPDLPQLIRLKYLTTVNRWTAMARPAGSLVAETDGDLSRSLMWRELLQRHGVTDIASVVFRDRFGCWGFLDLWRMGSHAFTADEVAFLSDISAPVTVGLRRSQAMTFVSSDLPPLGGGPVVLLLSPALEVRAQTGSTIDYLRLLVPPDEGRQEPVPAGAYNVAAQLLAGEAGVDANPPLARVHLSAGRWLTLRAGRIGDSPEPSERDIAVSIETISSDDRCRLFCRAFALSPRETQLLGHLVTGADTREIAARMFVSEHTVQDHLKSVFTKTGARSRGALLAGALGT